VKEEPGGCLVGTPQPCQRWKQYFSLPQDSQSHSAGAGAQGSGEPGIGSLQGGRNCWQGKAKGTTRIHHTSWGAPQRCPAPSSPPGSVSACPCLDSSCSKPPWPTENSTQPPGKEYSLPEGPVQLTLQPRTLSGHP
jgi:hypothetical protein